MKIITSKNDALSYIEALYPIGQDSIWDEVWLSTINDFGIQNLPTELLAIIAQKMVVEQGEICNIEIENNGDDEYENPYLLSNQELQRSQNQRNGMLPPY